MRDKLITINGHPVLEDDHGQWFVLVGYDVESEKHIAFNVLSTVLLDPDEVSVVFQSTLESKRVENDGTGEQE